MSGDGKLGASTMANQSCRWVFGLEIHDMNWIKLVRRGALMHLPVERITHRFLLAVLAGQGHRVIEVTTPWHPRFSGSSKFGKKRLLTSGRDFLSVLVWFYGETSLQRGCQHLTALSKSVKVAAKVGWRAFCHQWQHELQQTRTIMQKS